MREYKGSEEIPPEKKAGEKASEATMKARSQLSLLSTWCSASTPNNLWGKWEARFPWKKIVSEQTACVPWMDLYGEEPTKMHEQTWESFMDCVNFHLPTKFFNDAAET